MTGRVIRSHGRMFIVLADGHEYACEVLTRVKQGKNETPVAVGDLVDFSFAGTGPGAIELVHERRTKL